MDLIVQGYHHERKKTFYLHHDNVRKIGNLSFANRLNNILCHLGDNWLDLSHASMKSLVKKTIIGKVPAKLT
jgi:hypothetical protein